MNVLTKIRLINELNERELRMGVVGSGSSWHNQYKDSAWVYVGNMPYELSEGDVICVFSQYGEIVNVNLIREKKTGKSKGFAFVCYQDQRSTVLAVDNLNGSKIKSRQLRVDHVLAYKVPKEHEDMDDLTQKIHERGVAPSVMKEYQQSPVDSPSQVAPSDDSAEEKVKKKKKKIKKEKKKLSFLKEKSTKKNSKPVPDYKSDSSIDGAKSHKKSRKTDVDNTIEGEEDYRKSFERKRSRREEEEKVKKREKLEPRHSERENRRERDEHEKNRRSDDDKHSSSRREHVRRHKDYERSPDNRSHKAKRHRYEER